MLDHFNAASLAKLSKAELHAILANYLNLLPVAPGPEKSVLKAKIATVQIALGMRLG